MRAAAAVTAARAAAIILDLTARGLTGAVRAAAVGTAIPSVGVNRKKQTHSNKVSLQNIAYSLSNEEYGHESALLIILHFIFLFVIQ